MMAHVLSGGGASRFATPVPKRVWFPHCGSKPSWRDDRGESECGTVMRAPAVV
jgi:hypothetical protein